MPRTCSHELQLLGSLPLGSTGQHVVVCADCVRVRSSVCRSPVGWSGVRASYGIGRTVARGGDVVVAVETCEARRRVRAGVAAVRARCAA